MDHSPRTLPRVNRSQNNFYEDFFASKPAIFIKTSGIYTRLLNNHIVIDYLRLFY